MYMTWEVFFLFCTVVIDLLALVVMIYQNNKKKITARYLPSKGDYFFA